MKVDKLLKMKDPQASKSHKWNWNRCSVLAFKRDHDWFAGRPHIEGGELRPLNEEDCCLCLCLYSRFTVTEHHSVRLAGLRRHWQWWNLTVRLKRMRKLSPPWILHLYSFHIRWSWRRWEKEVTSYHWDHLVQTNSTRFGSRFRKVWSVVPEMMSLLWRFWECKWWPGISQIINDLIRKFLTAVWNDYMKVIWSKKYAGQVSKVHQKSS